MYVCICKAVTESRIRRAVGEGACSLRDLRNGLGVGTGCGKCLSLAQQVLGDSLHSQASPNGFQSPPIYLARSA